MVSTTVVDNQQLCFQCNICDHENQVAREALTREDPTCRKCHSTVRFRAIIQVLTTELFGESLRISQIHPRRKNVAGVGLSCWEGYAVPLARKLGFANTFFHKAPRLDITDVTGLAEGQLDFLIASDVFEHVDPPVQRAFDNVRRVLKPDGIFVFSVPFTDPGVKGIPAVEHYPELFDYEVLKKGDSYVVRNITRDGTVQVFEDPVFHGGPGSTLELRLFSEASIIEAMLCAGFADVKIYGGNDPAHGIVWQAPWSVPIVARTNPEGHAKLPVTRPHGRLVSSLGSRLRRWM